jgi:glucosaminylphosphatidylinositol acyltransferase
MYRSQVYKYPGSDVTGIIKMLNSFVDDLSGSTVLNINKYLILASSTIILYSQFDKIQFYISFFILIFPILLSLSLFTDFLLIFSTFILITSFILSFLLPIKPPLPSSRPHSATPISPFTLPVLSTYRAHLFILTFISILAVDFPIFPRYLAKCETYGYSLMDMGVGSFVFSQGIVSAIPILKSHPAPSPQNIFIRFRKSIPLFLLGLIRLFLLKATDYPEHESEYGTHWNFFFTLACLPLLQIIIHPILSRLPLPLIPLLISLAHQASLSFIGIEQFVLHAPRTSLISANKEGLVSLPGYLAIHLIGLSTGAIILPPSPSYLRRPQFANAPRQNDKTAIELAAYTLIWWSLFFISTFLTQGASRRMVSLQTIFFKSCSL